MKIFLIFTYHILLGLPLLSQGVEKHKYCVSDRPLNTPYFIPFYKTVRPALGCARHPGVDETSEVHVVRVDQPVDTNVFLYVTGSSNQTKLSLVLASPTPVIWHLTMSGFSETPSVVISDGSKIIDTTTGSELVTTAAFLNSVTITKNLAVAKFSYIHTFTSITAANRIFINLNSDVESTSTTCDIEDDSQSEAVEAFFVQKQDTFGCYHKEAAGLLPNDVHVIDLKEKKTVKRSASDVVSANDEIQDVVLELSPDEVLQDPLPRNLTLILKSEKPVKWVIKSKGIKGQLIIAAGKNKVEHESNNPDQDLVILRNEIPDAFESLIKEVTHVYGLPLSYIRVHQANLLEMLIPPRSKRELSSILEIPSAVTDNEQDDDIDHSDYYEEEDQIYVVAEKIKNMMTEECDEKNKRVSVKVPIEAISQFGIGSITLNDPSCLPQVSPSYWTLSSHSTECGALVLTYGASPMYRNNLKVKFDSGPLAGQKTKIPFICKFKPGIPGLTPEYDDYDDYNEDDHNGHHNTQADPVDLGEEMYNLKVQLVSENDEKRATLLETRTDSATVAIGDSIHISSHINAVQYLALAMEQCWITNTSRVTDQANPSDEILINSGCPASDDINLKWEKGSSNSAFSFKITKDIVAHKKIWIQCRMGLCSATKAGANGNLRRCIDPKYDCAENHQHKESSLQQITIRGPLHVIPVTRHNINDNIDKEKLEKEDIDESFSTQTSHTLVEVPVEVAIAIALASFIVGAMSTGVLWFLHTKAMQAKTRRLRSTEASELQSMISPGIGSGATSGPGPLSSHPHHADTDTIPPVMVTGDHNDNACTACPLI